MIWATVSSWSCFGWLYRVSPSLAAKNIINLILVLTIWWCPCVESSLVLLEELSHVQFFMTPWTGAQQASLSINNSRCLLKLMSIESVMTSNHLLLCCPLLLLPSIFPSIMVFSNESVLHISQPKYWSFRFNNTSCNEYSGLISFRMDWLDLLAVQGLSRGFSNTTV